MLAEEMRRQCFFQSYLAYNRHRYLAYFGWMNSLRSQKRPESWRSIDSGCFSHTWSSINRCRSVAAAAGIPYRTAQRWVNRYHQFGLAALARKRRAGCWRVLCRVGKTERGNRRFGTPETAFAE